MGKTILFLKWMLISVIFAQTGRHSISGKIFNAETNEPLFFAQVYISNTTKGTTSDKEGGYKITNIEPGDYMVIYSMMGFGTGIRKIRIVDNNIHELNIGLIPKDIVLDEVTIEGEKIEDWDQNFIFFKKNFLGVSEFARECKITNSEVISFERSRMELSAKAKVPLEIKNMALGYNIKVVLAKFQFNIEDNNGVLKYFPYYMDMKPSSKKEKIKWEQNRKKAFKGSLRHFLIHLKDTTFSEVGYNVQIVRTPDWDYVQSESEIERNRKYNIFNGVLVNSDSVLIKTKNNLYQLYTDRFMVQVTYFNEPEEKNFSSFKDDSRILGHQVSWLFSGTKKVLFDESGFIKKYKNRIRYFGYWAWQRIGDSLPEQYTLSKDEFTVQN